MQNILNQYYYNETTLHVITYDTVYIGLGNKFIQVLRLKKKKYNDF